MHINFKEDGTPEELKLVTGPGAKERIKTLIEEYENSSELKEEYDRLMQKKKEEYDAREASRILVG
jgi:phosphoglycolate phosphatase-like HAD superfamily hydrolase